MKFTNIGLIEFLSKYNHANSSYWYGTIAGQKASKALYTAKKRQYPAHYTASRQARYNNDIKLNKNVMDCIGAIKGYLMQINGKYVYQAKYDIGANGMFKKAKVKGKIKNIPEIPGLGLYKSGHAGVYLGNGKVFEASCFAIGIRTINLKDTSFTDWYEIPWIDYPSQDSKELNDEIINRLARECIDGKYGNGTTRKKKINALGYGDIYKTIQAKVNEILKGA